MRRPRWGEVLTKPPGPLPEAGRGSKWVALAGGQDTPTRRLPSPLRGGAGGGVEPRRYFGSASFLTNSRSTANLSASVFASAARFRAASMAARIGGAAVGGIASRIAANP